MAGAAVSRRMAVLAMAFAPFDLQAEAAPPPEVLGGMPGARLRGSGRMRALGLHIYDIRLWVGEGFVDYPQSPLALELEYARTLYGKLIADRSLAEMKHGGSISDDQAERWLAAMRKTFPDVAKGDRITGTFEPGVTAKFFFNSQACGEIRDAEFAQRFFGIWLSKQTSEPKLRDALLGNVKTRT
jgi:hypothetical protein